MWGGEEIFATTLVALATAQTALVTEHATQLLIFVLVMKAGLAVDAKSPTVQGTLTASKEEYAMPLWIPQSVKTVPRGGWGWLAMILVHTANKFPWIAATAFVSEDGLVLVVIVNAQSMERLSMRFANVT